MTNLSPTTAQYIIEQVGGTGQPPKYGCHFFSAGLDPYLSVIDRDYLSSFVKYGAAFKMVVGVYGGGKTHFLYCVRDLAWKHNFVVSYVELGPNHSPFHSLEAVYKAIAQGLEPPLSPEELLSGYEKGLVSFIRRWFSREYQECRARGLVGDELNEELLTRVERVDGVESISFANGVRAAFRSLLNKQNNDFDNIGLWLQGEGYDRRTHEPHGILQRLDRTTAFMMLRSLGQWIRQIGYSGLVILLDEAERIPSLSTRQREQHLSNLRELIDECGSPAFQGMMILYAVPGDKFLDEGRTQIYEALKQRLATVFETLNPTGVKIELEKIGSEASALLCEIGSKLSDVYENAYNHRFDESLSRETVAMVADLAIEQRFGDIGYKRLFVQKLVRAFHFLRLQGVVPSPTDLR